MEVDWKRFEYPQFTYIVPKVAKLYFGHKLQPEKYKAENSILFDKNQRRLAVVCRQKHLNTYELAELMDRVRKMETSAGLIVSASPQRFHVELIERSPGCWFPVAVWGRSQVNAIASINSELLSQYIPFRRRTLGNRESYVSATLGKGSVLWSDIVRFVQLGNEIGSKIGLNPTTVKRRTISRINDCFRRAGGHRATHWQKVGSDGWFHFYHEPSSSQVVRMAIDCMTQVQRFAVTDSMYIKHHLKVVMGMNEAEKVEVDPGGPLDNDSIIAYYLCGKEYKKYDFRATENAVLHLVDQKQQQQWQHFSTLKLADKREISVYGHQPGMARRDKNHGKLWSAGAVVVSRQEHPLNYLVLRRRVGGTWDFPVGKKSAEDGSPKDTAVREIREETGLKAKIVEGFDLLSQYSTSDPIEDWVLPFTYDGSVILFLAEVSSRNVTLYNSSEHDHFEWLPLEKALERLSFPNSRHSLLKAHEFLTERTNPPRH